MPLRFQRFFCFLLSFLLKMIDRKHLPHYNDEKGGFCMKSRNSVDYINFMRVTAMMMVFLQHMMSYTKMPNYNAAYSFLFRTPAWAGVWIFVFLSGYLMGKGFYSGRYPLHSVKDYFLFILKRFIRIAPAYYLYAAIVLIFFRRSFAVNYPTEIVKIFLFGYNGSVGVNGIGVLWYVSTVMQLYLVAPILYALVRLIRSKKLNAVLFFLVAAAGLGLRLGLRHAGLDWYKYIYTPFYANLDIFLCGMLVNALTKDAAEADIAGRARRILQVSACLSFLLLILSNEYIYYIQLVRDEAVYKYILPTLYALVCSAGVIAFDYKHEIPNSKLSLRSVGKNPLRLIDHLASVSFEIYMWHTLVFYEFSSVAGDSFKKYFIYFLCTFAISYVAALLLHLVGGGITKGLNRLLAGSQKKKNEEVAAS